MRAKRSQGVWDLFWETGNMPYTITQLSTFFTNANAGTAPTAAQLTGLQSIANQNATGTLSDAQALQSAIDMGSDVTTAVSVQSYQFFLGFAPSVAGLKALNAAYTGSGAQAGLNGENRFIAQAVSLALQNPTAKASFTAAYGSSSIADATAAAYNVIIGNAAAAAAGVNVANAVAFLSSASSIAYFEAFVKANVPGLAAADVSLAVKAAIVGEIIYQATIFNNGAGLGSYATAANNLVKDLADDGALTADNANGIALFDNYGVSPVAQTLTLTANADTLNGGAGADTFVATNTTLSAADSLTGGAGVDTLNYASNGNAAVNQAGFKAAGIETYNITSDAVGGTTFDMSGVTGATRVVNDDSSFDLTLTGLNEAATIVVRNTSQSVATVNTTVNYNAAVVAGTATTQALVLENVFDPAQAAGTASKSAVTVNGVEVFNVTGSGSATSNLTALNSNTLTTVNIDGGQGVKIDALTFAGATGTVDGSKNTGGINVTLTNSGAADVTVTGGTGNDRADFSNGFAAKDSFAGGAGTDTLVVSNTVAIGAVGGTLTGVEVLEVSGGGTGTVDLSKFAGVTSVVYTSTHAGSNGNSLAGATVVSKAGATSTITADVGATAQTLTVSVATDTAADATTINLNKVGTADAMGAITVTDIETLTVNVADDATVLGTGVLSMAGISGNKLATVNVTSNADVTITGAVGGSALKSFDISAATGKATLTGGVTTALTGATIKLGAGDDQVTVTATAGTATGGDTITLGAGKDVVTYTAVAQSGDKTTDTITDFVSGTDRLDLTALGLTTTDQFLGARASFGLAQGALTKVAGQAVFQADTNTLWIDNGDAQLDAQDFRIVLTGNSTLTAADLSLTSGATIALTAAAAVVNTTTNTNASAKSTNTADTITSTAAFADTSTINAGAGTDSLTLDFAAVTAGSGALVVRLNNAAASGDTDLALTGVESVTFNNVVATGNINLGANHNGENIVVNGADSAVTITTTVAKQTVTVNNTTGTTASTVTLGAVDDQVITTGAANDVFNTITQDKITISAGAGNDTFNVTNILAFDNDSNLLTLNGGTGTDSLVLANGLTANIDFTDTNDISITSIETLNVGQVGAASAVTVGAVGWTTLVADTTNAAVTFTGTGAQLSAVTTFTNTNGTNTYNLTVSDNGATLDLVGDTINGANDVDVITFGTGANVLKIDATNIAKVTGNVVAAGTTDTLELSNTATVANTKFNAFETLQAGGTAALNITDSGVGVARTIIGNSANNVIDLNKITAAKTVNIATGGSDTINVAHTSTAVVTVNGFTAGATASGGDVFKLFQDDGTTALSLTTNAGIVTTGATVVSAATNPSNAYIFSGASFQISGALTATGDGGAVEAAIIAANTTGAAANQTFVVALDNGTDTGIYVVTTAGAVNGTLDLASEFSVKLVGTLAGVADSGTLVAANLV